MPTITPFLQGMYRGADDYSRRQALAEASARREQQGQEFYARLHADEQYRNRLLADRQENERAKKAAEDATRAFMMQGLTDAGKLDQTEAQLFQHMPARDLTAIYGARMQEFQEEQRTIQSQAAIDAAEASGQLSSNMAHFMRLRASTGQPLPWQLAVDTNQAQAERRKLADDFVSKLTTQLGVTEDDQELGPNITALRFLVESDQPVTSAIGQLLSKVSDVDEQGQKRNKEVFSLLTGVLQNEIDLVNAEIKQAQAVLGADSDTRDLERKRSSLIEEMNNLYRQRIEMIAPAPETQESESVSPVAAMPEQEAMNTAASLIENHADLISDEQAIALAERGIDPNIDRGQLVVLLRQLDAGVLR